MVNRTNYDYDDIMINYMMREQIHFTYGRSSDPKTDAVYIMPINLSVSYTYKDISVSDLYRAILENKYGKEVGIGKDGYPEIEYRTVQRHLKTLKDEHILVLIPKENLSKTRKRNNRTLYKLHSDVLSDYLYYLLRLLTRDFMSERKLYLLLTKII